MRIESIRIHGSWVAQSPIWEDNRGNFREWFKSDEIKKITGRDFSVVQANTSLSNKGVLRGIHYSLAQGGQSKWITCIYGRVLDLVIDIRPNSPTYKQFEIIELNAGEGRAVLIGAGLGHAFLSLEDGSIMSYLLDSAYSPSEEFEINPLDKELGIENRLKLISGIDFILSSKDINAPTLAERFAQNKLPKF